MQQRLTYLALGTVICIVTFFIYQPGLEGRFIFDDAVNIVANKKLQIDSLSVSQLVQAATSADSGLLKRPVSYISFALNYYFTGLDPYYFKLINVIIHILNGIGLLFLSFLTLSALKKTRHIHITNDHIMYISIISSAIWLFHPINLTSVLYVVQRMNSLAAFFTILGIISYLLGRLRTLDNKGGMTPILFSYFIFWPLAALSKENGFLLPFFIFLFELIIFRFNASTRTTKKLISSIHISLYVVVGFGVAIMIVQNPNWITSTYMGRDFSLAERLLTESRVIWFYILLILLPSNNRLGIFHDDIVISENIISPITTIFSVSALALTVIFFAIRYKKHPILAFGVFFFFLGHTMESTFIGLEIAHEHRNYLPSFGIILALIYAIYAWSLESINLKWKLAGVTLFSVMIATSTLYRSDYWGDPVKHRIIEALHHPNSARANIAAGNAYYQLAKRENINTEKYRRLAQKHFEKAILVNERNTSGLFFLIEMSHHFEDEVNQNYIALLSKRIRSFPISANTLNWIFMSTSCIPACRLPPTVPPTLVENAINNPWLADSRKEEILSLGIDFALTRSNDIGLASRYADELNALSPSNPDAYIQIAKVQAILGNHESVILSLSAARKFDTHKTHTTVIDNLEKLYFGENRLRDKNNPN